VSTPGRGTRPRLPAVPIGLGMGDTVLALLVPEADPIVEPWRIGRSTVGCRSGAMAYRFPPVSPPDRHAEDVLDAPGSSPQSTAWNRTVILTMVGGADLFTT
jgi:hypothetical protein